MIGRLLGISARAESQDPIDILEGLKVHVDLISAKIESHSGIIVQSLGDSVTAFWHPDVHPNHAQLAFDASRSILDTLTQMAKQRRLTFPILIALGTGEFGGDYFGPIKQFQIIGKAVTMADAIFNFKYPHDSIVRFSQYTANLIAMPVALIEEGSIDREGLETLKVYGYRPANIG